MLALWFLTPLLLAGVLAGVVPVVLHLIFNAVARPEPFPTLRFLHQSMERTAMRRKIQHWLLMVLRITALVLLAIALAEPISEATGSLLLGRQHAAVIVLDNSLSMQAACDRGARTRFSAAVAEASKLLDGDDRPASAAVIVTGGGKTPDKLAASLDVPRQALATARCGASGGAINGAIERAIKLLTAQSLPDRAIYVFTDLQRSAVQDLPRAQALADARDVHLVFVNVGPEAAENVAVTDIAFGGRRVIGATVELTATVRNAGPADRTVDVALQIDNGTADLQPPRRVLLTAEGADGCEAKVRFTHQFRSAGVFSGRVTLSRTGVSGTAEALQPLDDLAADDVRRFTLDVSDRVRALVVSGPPGPDRTMTPTWMLQQALNPFVGQSAPWPIVTRTVASQTLSNADLQWAHAVFLCNVASLSDAQAGNVRAFVSGGGTVMVFLGPDVDPARYNAAFGSILPAQLSPAVGQVGPTAPAVTVGDVDTDHPFFTWLGPKRDALRPVTVQRYFALTKLDPSARVLMRLANGQPLLVGKQFGKGRTVLCATTASPKWTDLPVTPLFLPMVERATVLALPRAGRELTHVVGSTVTIKPGKSAATQATAVQVHSPSDGADPLVATVPLMHTPDGSSARFDQTDRLGTYRWYLTGRGLEASTPVGSFSVNPPACESDLSAADPIALTEAFGARGLSHVYIGHDLASARAAVDSAAQGRNWSSAILVCVLLALAVEAFAGNVVRVASVDCRL